MDDFTEIANGWLTANIQYDGEKLGWKRAILAKEYDIKSLAQLLQETYGKGVYEGIQRPARDSIDM